MLHMVIEKHDRTGDVLREFYDLYCHGCHFLGELGVSYGLDCVVPPSANSWEDMTEDGKFELLESFYPKLSTMLIRLLNG